MDPHTGKIYSPEEIPDLPTEIQDRLVPVSEMQGTTPEISITDETQELEAMSALLTEAKTMNEEEAAKRERFYPTNRKAKRAQFKKQGGFRRGR